MPVSLAANVDVVQPIQRSHELAHGLQFFGLSLPGLAGSARMHNLCDLPGPLTQGRHGTLSGMKTSSDGGVQATGWRPTSRLGGRGDMLCINGSEYVQIADSPSLKLVSTFTIGFWAYITIASGCILSKFSNGAGSAGADLRGIRLQTSLFVTEQGGNTLTGTVTLNTWQHWTVVSRSSGSLLYLNKNQVASGAILSAWFNNGGPVRIGAAEAAFFGSGATSLAGRLDAIMLWNRSLSAQNIGLLYDESVMGFPHLLNRVSARAFGQAAQSAFYYNWRRRVA